MAGMTDMSGALGGIWPDWQGVRGDLPGTPNCVRIRTCIENSKNPLCYLVVRCARAHLPMQRTHATTGSSLARLAPTALMGLPILACLSQPTTPALPALPRYSSLHRYGNRLPFCGRNQRWQHDPTLTVGQLRWVQVSRCCNHVPCVPMCLHEPPFCPLPIGKSTLVTNGPFH